MTDVNITGDIADLIGKAQVFGNSENIRCGKYEFLIKRCFEQATTNGYFAFAELQVLKSAPNPQFVGPDNGTNPNSVGSLCAMKVNFSGNGALSAPGNVKAFILGLFGKTMGEMSDTESGNTWRDLRRQKDLRVGDATGIDAQTNQPILATKAKRANPACGMIVGCTANMKEKGKTKKFPDLPAAQREYVTALNWECVARPGEGINAPELVAQRRAEIESTTSVQDDDGDTVATAFTPTTSAGGHSAPPAPPVAAVSAFTPPAPWRPHPTAKGWYWDGGTGVKSEAQLRSS